METKTRVLYFADFSESCGFVFGEVFGKSRYDVGLRLAGKMDDDWAIQILFEILDDSVEIVLGGLNQVDGGDPMKLLPKIFDVEV